MNVTVGLLGGPFASIALTASSVSRKHGVFPGAADTDMIRSFVTPKTPALDVARATLDGIEAGEEDIFPDPMSREIYTACRQDHKAVERQFAAM